MRKAKRALAPWVKAFPKQRPARMRPKLATLQAQYRARVKVWLVGKRCAADCRAKADQCHHSRGRIGPLLLDERFWVPVCGPCHRWIDANRAEARRLGLLCQPGEFNTPVGVSNQ